jgi:type I restriction enzyme, S subunit
MTENRELPKGWTNAIFEDLLDYIQPTNFIVESTEYDDNYKTPVLTAGKSFIIGHTHETNGIYNEIPVIIFDDFTTTSQFVNFAFKVKSSAMKILKPTSNFVNIKLVFYYMQTLRINVDTHKRYWISQYSQLPIPLPPLPEQSRIVAKIEELFSSLDKGIENLKIAQQQLKVYRQAVLKWALEGKLTNENVVDGELPEGWMRKTLREIGKWTGGGTPSKQNKLFWENGNIFWVSPKDMKSKVIIDTIDKITRDAIDHSSAKLIEKGSVLFVVRSGILRRTLPIAKTQTMVTVNQDIQALTPEVDLSDYIYWCVRAFNNDIRNKCSKDGTTVESIESSLLKNYPIPLPPLPEQYCIVAEIESRLSVCDKIEESIEQSLKQSEALRQSILKKAFEGKLVPQDPSDEPASVLLERICAERALREARPENSRKAQGSQRVSIVAKNATVASE